MKSLIEGFEAHSIRLADTELMLASGGSGPPLVLLHGFPQCHAMWARVAPTLAQNWHIFAFDLPGYGQSGVPTGGPARYSKSRIADDIREAMRQLGHYRFAVAGHDRGGRVAYRMALDTPEAVTSLTVLDIVPTGVFWNALTPELAMKYFHWTFLAQPLGLPEAIIGQDPVAFLERSMSNWSKAGNLSDFTPEALASYREAICDPQRLTAMCDDYRAGATIDYEDDKASMARGETIVQPVLALWGAGAPMADTGAQSVIDVWQAWAPRAQGVGLDCGHFLCEEDPDGVLAAMVPFLERAAATTVS